MTNRDIILNWLTDSTDNYKSTSSNIDKYKNYLYSYGTIIAIKVKVKDNYIVFITTAKYSTTTSHHTSLVKTVCDELNIPVSFINIPNKLSTIEINFNEIFTSGFYERLLFLLKKYKYAKSKKAKYLNIIKKEIRNFLFLIEEGVLEVDDNFKHKILKIMFCYDKDNYKKYINLSKGI